MTSFFSLINNFSVINNKISVGWFHTSIRSISPNIPYSTPSHKHKNPFNIKTLSIWLIFYLYLSSSAITSHSLKIYGRKITPGCTLVKFIQLFSVIKMYDSIYIHQHPPIRTTVRIKFSLSHPFYHTNIPSESETEHRKHETQGRFNLILSS